MYSYSKKKLVIGIGIVIVSFFLLAIIIGQQSQSSYTYLYRPRPPYEPTSPSSPNNPYPNNPNTPHAPQGRWIIIDFFEAKSTGFNNGIKDYYTFYPPNGRTWRIRWTMTSPGINAFITTIYTEYPPRNVYDSIYSYDLDGEKIYNQDSGEFYPDGVPFCFGLADGYAIVYIEYCG